MKELLGRKLNRIVIPEDVPAEVKYTNGIKTGKYSKLGKSKVIYTKYLKDICGKHSSKTVVLIKCVPALQTESVVFVNKQTEIISLIFFFLLFMYIVYKIAHTLN